MSSNPEHQGLYCLFNQAHPNWYENHFLSVKLKEKKKKKKKRGGGGGCSSISMQSWKD